MSLEQEVELIRQFPIFAKIQPAMQKLLCFSAERLTQPFDQLKRGWARTAVLSGTMATSGKSISRSISPSMLRNRR